MQKIAIDEARIEDFLTSLIFRAALDKQEAQVDVGYVSIAAPADYAAVIDGSCKKQHEVDRNASGYQSTGDDALRKIYTRDLFGHD